MVSREKNLFGYQPPLDGWGLTVGGTRGDLPKENHKPRRRGLIRLNSGRVPFSPSDDSWGMSGISRDSILREKARR